MTTMLIGSILFIQSVIAQRMTAAEYIRKYKDLTMKQWYKFKVPPILTMAQGLLETKNGNSPLLKVSNNHFGIKKGKYWTGQTIPHDDEKKGELFRKYETAEASYEDHSLFLVCSSRYAKIFQIDPSNGDALADEIKKDGYATSKKYIKNLKKIMKDNNLESLFDLRVIDPTIEPLQTNESVVQNDY